MKKLAVMKFTCRKCNALQEIDLTKKGDSKHEYYCSCGAYYWISRKYCLVYHRPKDTK